MLVTAMDMMMTTIPTMRTTKMNSNHEIYLQAVRSQV
jgi:hypothetical protein